VFAANGKSFDPGTVIVRNGIIEAVGKTTEIVVPADAETIDAKGMAVYPGFLDLYTTLGTSERGPLGPKPVPAAMCRMPIRECRALRSITETGSTPEFDVASNLELPDATSEERRKLGFTDILAAPGGAIASGQSALVSLSGLPRREAIVKPNVALHIQLTSPSGITVGDTHDCIDELIT